MSILTTTNPESGPWKKTPVPDFLAKVSCPSTSLCVAFGDHGALYTSTKPAAGAWAKATIGITASPNHRSPAHR